MDFKGIYQHFWYFNNVWWILLVFYRHFAGIFPVLSTTRHSPVLRADSAGLHPRRLSDAGTARMRRRSPRGDLLMRRRSRVPLSALEHLAHLVEIMKREIVVRILAEIRLLAKIGARLLASVLLCDLDA